MSLKIRRIADNEERELVIQAAIDDNDNMHFPTHVIEKGGEIAGSLCLGAVPLVMGWSKSDTIKARDSLVITNTVHTLMDDRKVGRFFVACNSNSPYINHMRGMGYDPVWPTNIFISR